MRCSTMTAFVLESVIEELKFNEKGLVRPVFRDNPSFRDGQPTVTWVILCTYTLGVESSRN